jgi:hypothetical protein
MLGSGVKSHYPVSFYVKLRYMKANITCRYTLLRLILRRINSFSKYKDGWDDLHSKGPTAQALDDAKTFIRTFDFTVHCLPDIALASDGEINFWWNTGDLDMDLGFYGNGTYCYYAHGKFVPNEGGKYDYEWETSVDDVLPTTPLSDRILKLLIKGSSHEGKRRNLAGLQ